MNLHAVIPSLRLWITIAIVTSGCNDRVAEVSREAAERQADQNRLMAELQQEVARGTDGLVTADAAARRDFVGVHRDLQTERRRLDGAWESLESERRALAADRRSESWLTPTAQIVGGALLLAALLTFLRQLLCGSAPHYDVELELNELLLGELLPPHLARVEHPSSALSAESVSKLQDQPIDGP